jgi:hypothetical protein
MIGLAAVILTTAIIEADSIGSIIIIATTGM